MGRQKKGKKSSNKLGSASKKSSSVGAKFLAAAEKQSGMKWDTSIHNLIFQRRACVAGLRRALNPFPDVWRGLIRGQFSGKSAVGAAAAGRFDVCGNSPFLPWNTASGFPGPIDVANNVNTTAGYNLLCGANGPYLAYRVYGSAVEVSVANEAAVDNLEIVIAPYQTTAQTNLTLAGQSRWSRQATVGFGDGVVRLSNTLATTEMTGDGQQAIQYQSGNAAAYNAYPASLWFWACFYSLASAAVTTGQIAWKATVCYDVCFENPQFDAADLDSVSEDDKNALAKHLRKQAIRRRNTAAEEARLDAAAYWAETDSAADDKKTSEHDSVSYSSSSSSCSSSVRPVVKRAASKERK